MKYQYFNDCIIRLLFNPHFSKDILCASTESLRCYFTLPCQLQVCITTFSSLNPGELIFSTTLPDSGVDLRITVARPS